MSISKWFKKQRLIRKYRRTPDKMEQDLNLLRIAGSDTEMKRYFIHQIHCELRCLARLKNL